MPENDAVTASGISGTKAQPDETDAEKLKKTLWEAETFEAWGEVSLHLLSWQLRAAHTCARDCLDLCYRCQRSLLYYCRSLEPASCTITQLDRQVAFLPLLQAASKAKGHMVGNCWCACLICAHTLNKVSCDSYCYQFHEWTDQTRSGALLLQ